MNKYILRVDGHPSRHAMDQMESAFAEWVSSSSDKPLIVSKNVEILVIPQNVTACQYCGTVTDESDCPSCGAKDLK